MDFQGIPGVSRGFQGAIEAPGGGGPGVDVGHTNTVVGTPHDFPGTRGSVGSSGAVSVGEAL